MERLEYDLVVIGSGPAGENGAATAASFGKKVAMVEKAPVLGGASANTGTLPSKTLRETALAISGLRARDLYGVDLSLRREATVADFMYHEKHVKHHERTRVERNIARHGIDLYHGLARFEDPHTLRIARPAQDDLLLRGEAILIAAGSSPVQPPEFPFDDPRVYDSDEILLLGFLPKVLAVIGAGVIGSEYACTFAALGTKVHILDGRDELLPFLDADISGALERAMIERLDISFHWKERVASCDISEPDEIMLALTSGAMLPVDAVLVAAGRTSNTAALNLEAAGITPGKRGLLSVDAGFRTSVPHIYAAGDVIGFPALASTSMQQARVAMCHAFDAGHKTAVGPLLPSGIYTIPEVSIVGQAEEDLKAKGVSYVIGRAQYAQNARGEIIGDDYGFLKLIFLHDDMTLLGVHVIGEQASEVVHIGLIAMLNGATAELFLSACFNYPTLGDLYRDATINALRTRQGLTEC
jgi:NAD(P) transhydrogenase